MSVLENSVAALQREVPHAAAPHRLPDDDVQPTIEVQHLRLALDAHQTGVRQRGASAPEANDSAPRGVGIGRQVEPQRQPVGELHVEDALLAGQRIPQQQRPALAGRLVQRCRQIQSDAPQLRLEFEESAGRLV